jgi:O-antigen/teichoic acid export membrane protein
MLQRILNSLKDPTSATLARGGSIVLLFKVIGALGGYFLLFSLARTGGENAVGVYEVAFTMILIGSTAGRWGLDTVLVKELGKVSSSAPSKKLYLAVFYRVLLFSTAVGVLLFFAARILTDAFFVDTPVEIIRTAALAIVPFTLMLLNAEAYRGIQKPILFSLNQHGTVYIAMALLLWIWPMESAGLNAQSSAQLALLLLLGLSGLFAAFSTIHVLSLCEDKVWFSEDGTKSLLQVATPMLISSALFLVMSWSDTLMLSYYLPEDQVGVYRIAFKITTLITFAQFAINTIAAPMISGLHSGGEKMVPLAKKIAQFNLISAGPSFIVIVGLGSYLIGLFGVENATMAYPWLVLLAIGQLANAFAGPVLNILNMTGHEVSARNTMLVMATLNIGLNALMIPMLGPAGAALATSATMIGWNLWAGILVYRFHGLITVPFFAHKSKTE